MAKKKAARKTTTAEPKFPSFVYVTHQDDGDGTFFLSATRNQLDESIEDGQNVAVYALQNVRLMRVTRGLE